MVAWILIAAAALGALVFVLLPLSCGLRALGWRRCPARLRGFSEDVEHDPHTKRGQIVLRGSFEVEFDGEWQAGLRLHPLWKLYGRADRFAERVLRAGPPIAWVCASDPRRSVLALHVEPNSWLGLLWPVFCIPALGETGAVRWVGALVALASALGLVGLLLVARRAQVAQRELLHERLARAGWRPCATGAVPAERMAPQLQDDAQAPLMRPSARAEFVRGEERLLQLELRGSRPREAWLLVGSAPRLDAGRLHVRRRTGGVDTYPWAYKERFGWHGVALENGHGLRAWCEEQPAPAEPIEFVARLQEGGAKLYASSHACTALDAEGWLHCADRPRRWEELDALLELSDAS